MSEKIKLQDTFDPNSKIENITLSATYIFALEELMMDYITQKHFLKVYHINYK